MDGHVVSRTSQRYIINLLAATQTSKLDDPLDSSDDSDNDIWKSADTQAGNMDLVHRSLNGIAARSGDDGTRGFGRHSDIIRMGRALWQTPALDSMQQRGITERFFDDGKFPSSEESKFAVVRKDTDIRPAPFQRKTLPYLSLSFRDYGRRIDNWFTKLRAEAMTPASEDLTILRAVTQRILVEFQLEGCDLPKMRKHRQAMEEPMRGFIHGPPGTGKSRLIHWITRFFREALGGQHGMQFLCVAFQNRVAHAMGGVTLQSGGDVSVCGGDKSLSHTDVDVLFTRNQDARWLLFDEIGMIPDCL